MSARISKAGIAGIATTLVVMIPILFFLKGNSVNTNQSIAILCGVVALVLWAVVYVKLVDPFLRRGAGTLLGVPIELQGGRQRSPACAPSEARGRAVEIFVGLVGFFVMFLWFAPFLAAICYVMFFRH